MGITTSIHIKQEEEEVEGLVEGVHTSLVARSEVR